jgi:hypothetical protein
MKIGLKLLNNKKMIAECEQGDLVLIDSEQDLESGICLIVACARHCAIGRKECSMVHVVYLRCCTSLCWDNHTLCTKLRQLSHVEAEIAK